MADSNPKRKRKKTEVISLNARHVKELKFIAWTAQFSKIAGEGDGTVHHRRFLLDLNRNSFFVMHQEFGKVLRLLTSFAPYHAESGP